MCACHINLHLKYMFMQKWAHTQLINVKHLFPSEWGLQHPSKKDSVYLHNKMLTHRFLTLYNNIDYIHLGKLEVH